MKSDIENKNWLDEYMSLKQITPGNPFTVPQGYFDDLSERIISYKNLTELKENIPAEGFTIPESYFEELAGNIQSRIALEEALSLDEGKNAFTVPEGYFENLAGQIQSRIRVEEALAGADKHFTVPENYFDQLNKSILNKTVNQDIVKRKGTIIRFLSSTAFKYATAACFILLVGSGILIKQLTNDVPSHENTFLHKQLSGIPSDEIQSYLQLNNDANDTQREVTAQGVAVDDNSLNSALQDYVDNVQ
ncbi:hypothetical protein BH09BAC6_BH09BAC6_31450 [soil metagenome]|jgi:hypothetical protein